MLFIYFLILLLLVCILKQKLQSYLQKLTFIKQKKTLTELLRFTIMIIIPIIGKIRFQKCLFGDTEHCKDHYVLYGR